ncbi:MAG TPA: GH1 family beta-glucosidase [bacterium]|nr:GH1 family beta-glucosidase [bacterium]
MQNHFISFPKDFIWGAATSSFQIEGSPLADGAVESNWYRWTKLPSKIADGSNADKACDHYNRYKEDVGLMKELGLKSYRFSLSWPRIMPERGKVNEKGVDFYRRLIEELNKAGILPNATLFHWEVPTWAEGGWENRETALAFAEYAQAVFKRLGNDVPFWATQNESLVTAHLGYLWGYFPPGKEDKKAAGWVNHHLNLGHGLAVQAFRAAKLKGEVGTVAALGPFRASTNNKADIEHAQHLKDLCFGAFLDPLVGRGYPEFFFKFTGLKPSNVEKDLKDIAQPIDFLGVNHYFPNYVRYAPGLTIFDNDFTMPEGFLMNDMDWPVVPDAFRDLLVDLHKTYGFKKLFVTENGLPTRDSLRDRKETLEDEMRVHYLGNYLSEALKAIEAGVPLKGYYAWSLMDNFEWNHGFDPRFGLIHVDFKTGERTFKNSAKWYQKVIADKGFSMDLLPKNPPYRVFHADGHKARNF